MSAPAPITVVVHDSVTCASCGAPEVENPTAPVSEWRFNIRAFRVDDWSECCKCGCWFNLAGEIERPAKQLTLTIPGRHTAQVADFAEASKVYADVREDSFEGASTFPEGIVTCAGVFVGRVSYNGRVWREQTWTQGDKPIYDPSAS